MRTSRMHNICVFRVRWKENALFKTFNPDGYTDSKGKKRKGMFHANGKQNFAEVKRRLTYLKKEMDKQIERCERDENTELLDIHKLFSISTAHEHTFYKCCFIYTICFNCFLPLSIKVSNFVSFTCF